MATNTTDRQLVWVGLSLVAGLVVLPGFATRVGLMSGELGYVWGSVGEASGWLLVSGAGHQLVVLAILGGAGYLGYKALTSRVESSGLALEAPRAACARGECSATEFERHRERLQTEH